MRLLAKLTSVFLRIESGATSIDYALGAGSVSIVIVAAVTGIGNYLKGRFEAVDSALK